MARTILSWTFLNDTDFHRGLVDSPRKKLKIKIKGGKMFRKLLLIVAFVAAGAGAYGIARAYFSNQIPASSTATFNTGSISINIGPHSQNDVPFVLDNWMPGDTQEVVFDVNNTSTVPVTLSGSVNGTWGDPLGDQMVYVIAADYWNGSAWRGLSTSGHGTFVYADRDNPSILLQVPSGGSVSLRMTGEFDKNADNRFQNKTYTATLFVTAEQVHS
jgi:hypothetical protein